MRSRTEFIFFIVIVAVILLVIQRQYVGMDASPSPIATVSYRCDAGKTLTAVLYAGETMPSASPDQPPIPGGSVELTLSDGRALTLAQTISADGTRYANADDSFVFWGKGSGALVLENNQQKSYTGCIRVSDAANLPLVFASSEQGFSLRLPADYTPDTTYQYQAFGPTKSILGTKFTIAPIAATSTNLASDTYISVEEIPQIQDCNATLFLDQGGATFTVEDNETTYSVATSTGAGAGNRYEETVYAIPGTNPCTAVRYFIHYGAFENYPVGAVQEFDKQALIATFDTIRHTLIVVQ